MRCLAATCPSWPMSVSARSRLNSGGGTQAGCPPSSSLRPGSGGCRSIVFEREVAFVGITEAVHARIIDEQSAELRAAARLHEVFTDLAVAGAAAGRDAPAGGAAGRAAGDPGGSVPSRARLRGGRGGHGAAARRVRGPVASGGAAGPDRLRPGIGVADHDRGGAGRGLGTGHPGLRRAAPAR